MDGFEFLLKAFTEKYPGVEVLENEPMSLHTTFKIGGTVRVMFFPETSEQVQVLLLDCRRNGVECLMLGNGSNILISDRAHEIAVINTARLCGISVDGTRLRAQAGARLSKIASEALKGGLTGFEFAAGIPGTLGGALIMNAGAYGGEMKDVVAAVELLDKDGQLAEYDNGRCGFGYRQSALEGCVLLAATIELDTGSRENIKVRMDELAMRRREKQPLTLPSAGSTFKRPEKGYAAAMIEEVGLKGFSIGGAQVSEKHAGFVVNTGRASFDDVIRVIEHVQDTVFQRTGIRLSPEVKIIR